MLYFDTVIKFFTFACYKTYNYLDFQQFFSRCQSLDISTLDKDVIEIEENIHI